MGVKITKKQKRILDYISDYMNDHSGDSPSYREIAAGLGLKSVASVAEHIDHLVALGALKKSSSGRSLELVDMSYPETTQLFRIRYESASAEEKEILRQAANIIGIELLPDQTGDEK